MAENQNRSPYYSENNLIWMDLEMTGLEPQINRIIEMAAVVTDSQLNVIAESPVVVLHQDEYALTTMDNWNTE
ncbi:MAG: oligoribonuclease, partial [Burkholderiales bacterium]|nr:oligoribonuclease [Burkholderiales bacterium]